MENFGFSTQICPKMDLGFEIQKTNVAIRTSILEILCIPIFKQTKHFWLFLAEICPNMDLRLEIEKTNVGIIFRQKEQLWLFWPKFAHKWILGSEFQKCKSGFGISTFKIQSLPIFSQNEQLWIFRSKFGEIAQSCAIFWF